MTVLDSVASVAALPLLRPTEGFASGAAAAAPPRPVAMDVALLDDDDNVAAAAVRAEAFAAAAFTAEDKEAYFLKIALPAICEFIFF